MIADGFTKPLQVAKFIVFREQIGLVDISNRLSQRLQTDKSLNKHLATIHTELGLDYYGED
jgi:hypothetical protein